MNKSKRIFTFWEPKEKIPAHISVCMETWKKFLPEYEIVLRSYDNLGQYLDKETINKILTTKISLPKQADCIRVAILYQYGGIWLDADTIITGRDFFDNLRGKDCIMLGTSKGAHVAFIYAPVANNSFLHAWLEQIIKRVLTYKIFHLCSIQRKILKNIFKSGYRKMEDWSYFGNDIIDPMVKDYVRDLTVVSRDKIGAFLERLSSENTDDINPIELYQNFYFSSKFNKKLEYLLSQNNGIVLLHNSWTPKEYQNSSRQEFLSSSIFLAELLRKIL